MIFRRSLRAASAIESNIKNLQTEVNNTIEQANHLFRNADRTLSLINEVSTTLGIIEQSLNQIRRIYHLIRRLPGWGRVVAQAVRSAVNTLRTAVRILRRAINRVKPLVTAFRILILQRLQPQLRTVDLKFAPVDNFLDDVIVASALLEPQQNVIEPLLPDAYKARINQALDQIDRLNSRAATFITEIHDLNTEMIAWNDTLSMLYRLFSNKRRLLNTFEEAAVFIKETITDLFAQINAALPQWVKDIIETIADAIDTVTDLAISVIGWILDQIGIDLSPLLRRLESLLDDLAQKLQVVREVVEAMEELIEPFREYARAIEQRILRKIEETLLFLIEVERIAEELRNLLNGLAEWKELIEMVTPEQLKELEELIQGILRRLGEGEGSGTGKQKELQKLIDKARESSEKLLKEVFSKPIAPVEIGKIYRLYNLKEGLKSTLGKLSHALTERRYKEQVFAEFTEKLSLLQNQINYIQEEIREITLGKGKTLPKGYFQDLRRYLDLASYRQIELLADEIKKTEKRISKKKLKHGLGKPILYYDKGRFRFQLRIPKNDPRFDLLSRAFKAAGILPEREFPQSIKYLDPRVKRKVKTPFEKMDLSKKPRNIIRKTRDQRRQIRTAS